MPTRPKNQSVKFNVILDPATYAALSAMAEHELTVRAQIIRKALRERYRMTFENQPTCADGSGCLCPLNHQVRQQTQQAQPTRPAPPDPDTRKLLFPTGP